MEEIRDPARHLPTAEHDNDNVLTHGFDDTNAITNKQRPPTTNGPTRMHLLQSNRHRRARRCRLLRPPDVASKGPWVGAWEENNGGSRCL